MTLAAPPGSVAGRKSVTSLSGIPADTIEDVVGVITLLRLPLRASEMLLTGTGYGFYRVLKLLTWYGESAGIEF